jgi:hypothetical protein
MLVITQLVCVNYLLNFVSVILPKDIVYSSLRCIILTCCTWIMVSCYNFLTLLHISVDNTLIQVDVYKDYVMPIVS